jgi:hypothetical protein
MSSFYEFYKKINQEKRIHEINAQLTAPQVPTAQGQGVSPPANDKALQGIQGLWNQMRTLVPKLQDPALKKELERLQNLPALQGQNPPAKQAQTQPPNSQQQAQTQPPNSQQQAQTQPPNSQQQAQIQQIQQ